MGQGALMADVYTYVEPTGVIVPDAQVIQAQVEAEYKNTFGQDLIVTANTPQGMLITAETTARIAVADNNVALANQINPNLAGGVYLDALMALTGIQRSPGFPSTVLCTVSGTSGTVISSLAQISDITNGYVFSLLQDVTIPDSGTLSGVLFTSLLIGPIPAAANTLTNIVTPVLGWDSVTNPLDAVLGEVVQSDTSARQYRAQTLAFQGLSTAQAITSSINTLPPMAPYTSTSCYFLENTSSSTQTLPLNDMSGVSMVSHSIYVCVNGGAVGTVSTVNVTITGSSGTVIPAFSQVYETNSGYNFLFQTLTSHTIPSGGTLTDIPMASVQTGTVPAVAGSLTHIVVPISGWNTVTNPLAATFGTESTIAQTLVATKSAGASYNNTALQSQGNAQSAVITVPFSNQIMTVLFDTPAIIDIKVQVTVYVVTPVQDVITTVQQTIETYCYGGVDGIAGLVVGQNVSPFELAGAITSQYPGIYVQNLQIGLAPSGDYQNTEIVIQPYQIAQIATSSIKVIVLTAP